MKLKLKDRARNAAGFVLVNAFAINVIGLLAAPTMVAEAVNIGQIGGNLDTNTKGLSKGASSILYFLGFTGSGVGVWKIMQAKKQQGQGMGEGVGLGVGGAVLASLPALIETFSSSTFGTNQSGGGLGRLDVE